MNERSSCYPSTSIRSFALFIAALPEEGKEAKERTCFPLRTPSFSRIWEKRTRAESIGLVSGEIPRKSRNL
jgi:hypothetical protein